MYKTFEIYAWFYAIVIKKLKIQKKFSDLI